MDKDYLIQLTNEIYRLTLLFPKKEPLRYKMRELADEILANTILVNNNPSYKPVKRHSQEVVENLEVLDSYFAVAKEQNWVSPSEIFAVQEEYGKIVDKLIERLDEVGLEKKTKKPLEGLVEDTERVEVREGIGAIETKRNLRQEKILEILRDRGRAQVWEIQKIFPDVTKRTLRRDFEQLLKQRLIERMGKRNETFYQLKLQ